MFIFEVDLGWRGWKSEGYGGSLVGLALELDSAAVEFHNGFDDRQAQARPGFWSGIHDIYIVETIKYSRKKLRIYARTSVFDGHCDPSIFGLFCREENLSIPRGIPEGIGKQIGKCLTKQNWTCA